MSDINKTNTKDGKPAFHLTLTQFDISGNMLES